MPFLPPNQQRQSTEGQWPQNLQNILGGYTLPVECSHQHATPTCDMPVIILGTTDFGTRQGNAFITHTQVFLGPW